jgi:hypothetical protein
MAVSVNAVPFFDAAVRNSRPFGSLAKAAWRCTLPAFHQGGDGRGREVCFLPFFVEPHPTLAALHKVILDAHLDRLEAGQV